MTYTAIPNGDIDPDSPLITSLFVLLRDNPIAMMNGDTGAPQMQTAGIADQAVSAAKILNNSLGKTQIAANGVGQSEIHAVSQFIDGQQTFTSAGGIYTLGWDGQSRSGNDRTMYWRRPGDSDSSGYLAEYFFEANNSTNDNARLYYISASPPYDLGDGQIPLFMYFLVDNATAAIEAINFASDPPWAYNGPTDIRPHRYGKKGKIFRLRRDMSGYPDTLAQAKAKGGRAIKDYMQAFAAAGTVEEEITQAIKNADMELIPAFFKAPAGKTVVMADPMSPVLLDILEMSQDYDSPEFQPGELIRNYMKIGNTQLNRKGPSSVLISSIKWK